jgi:transglutaminase-like putative cysteine protease
VIGGATALTPLVAGGSWLIPIAEVAAVVWLVGVGSRLVGLPAWGASLLQLAAYACSLTGLHLHTGIGGILPGPAAIGEAATTVHAAWEQIMTTVPPMQVTAEVSFFITLTIGALSLVVDYLVAAARTPALVALPLLGLYSVPAAIAAELLPWYAFALPAACFAATLATSQPRTGRLQPRAAWSLAITSVVIAIAAIGAAVTLSDAAIGIGTEGRIPHSGGSSGEVGLSPWARLRGNLTDDNPVDIARIDGGRAPEYLRTFALEKWEPGTGFVLGTMRADNRNIDGSSLDPESRPAATETITITPAHYRDKYLPIYLGTSAIQGLGSGWNFDTSLRTVFRSAATTPNPYTVTTNATVATEAALRADTVSGNPSLTVTGDLPPAVTDLAKRVTAGTTNAFDTVDALLTFFTDPANGFTYSLKTPTGDSGDALTDFLTNRVGYCEQYAAAMTIMIRSLGIPARVGIGFTQGARQSDGSYLITSNNAHAWVEVPFDDAGWIIFDPTPSVNGQGGLQGFAAGGTSPDETSTDAATSTAPTQSNVVAPTLRGPNAVETAIAPADAASQPVSGWGLFLRWTGLVLMSCVILLLAAATPALLRSSRRRRRLAQAAGGGADATSAAWREIVDTAVDHGINIGAGDSARQIATVIAHRAGMTPPSRDKLKTVVTAAEQDWYGATPHTATPDLTPGVHAVIIGLQHYCRMPRRSRWWPPSLRRRVQ